MFIPEISNLTLSTVPLSIVPSVLWVPGPLFAITPSEIVSNEKGSVTFIPGITDEVAEVKVPSTTLATKRDSPPSVK